MCCAMCVCVCACVENHREQDRAQGCEKGRGKETEITSIDFLTFSVGEKAVRDLPGGERERENVVRKQRTHTLVQR